MMPDSALLSLPWWGIALYVLVLGFAANLSVSLFLHRSMTHGGVTFHPLLAIPMRALIWLTTGMTTKEWVATHRKHHAFSDREGDPHSPLEEGLLAILLGNAFYYRRAARDATLLEKYGKGTPDDWLERNVFAKHNFAGVGFLLLLDLALFGLVAGGLAWLATVVWMPFWGGVINGIGHAVGYRNFKVKDVSRNILSFGLIAAGEELHNNHHADPRSAKFSARWFEFDAGWLAIRLCSGVGLARVEYARKLSVEEFNAKHYHEDVALTGAGLSGGDTDEEELPPLTLGGAG